MAPIIKTCIADGCNRSSDRRDNGIKGFCSMHYQRWKKHGDASIVKSPPSPAKDWIAANISYAGDDCLTWPFHISAKDGYGRAHRANNGPIATASNLVCEAAHGPAPSPNHECAHSCGRGHLACVNPRHLRWATPDENQNERVAHGTSNRGTQQGSARLSDDDVRSIRALAGATSQTDLAERYGVNHSHISRIVRRESWAWLL